MINFKSVEPKDRKLLTSYIFPTQRRDSNLSVANLCSWQFLTCSSYAILDHYLVLRFCFTDNRVLYSVPEAEKAGKEIIVKLARQALEEEMSFYLYGIVPEMQVLLENYFPKMFDFRQDRNYYDYLYLRKDLAELKGKDYQPKRNHVNKFRKRYDYRYSPLTHAMIPDCEEMYREWCEDRRCEKDPSLRQEREALLYAMEHYKELELEGGALWVEGKIIAFTFGAPVNHDTFCVHAEKALPDFEGAYNAINQEFARHLPDTFVYLNREEDLGVPGLRQAKLSYRPVQLLEKGIAVCPPYFIIHGSD